MWQQFLPNMVYTVNSKLEFDKSDMLPVTIVYEVKEKPRKYKTTEGNAYWTLDKQ